MKQNGEKKVHKRKTIPFYQRRGPVLFCKIAGIFAGAMMLAAPFFHWRVVWVKADIRVREGFSLFDVLKYVFGNDFTGKRGMRFLVVGLLVAMIVAALWVLYFAYRDQLYPDKDRNPSTIGERFFRKFRLISHLLPLVLSIGGMIGLQKTTAYALLYDRMEETYRSWKPLVEGGSGYHDWKLPGLGCILLVVGILLYLISGCLRYLINTLNEDD